MPVLELARPSIAIPRDRDDELKAPHSEPRFLSLPERCFVMIDGSGAPGPEAFTQLMPGLYGTAYSLHFYLKRRGINAPVWPLEGLWWTTDDVSDYATAMASDRGTWRWTLMIALPAEATDDEIARALDAGRVKLTLDLAPALRAETFAEGLVAQIMHVGPYSEEGPTIARMHEGIAEAGLEPFGRHHEIYLGDPRRSAPERLRTLLRQPCRESGAA